LTYAISIDSRRKPSGRYSLFDPGAFSEPPLSGKITMKVTNPWIEQPDEKERDAIERAEALMAKLKDRSMKK
jgi:hypothetical protein